MKDKPRLTKEYKLCWHDGNKTHIWSIVGVLGGICLRIIDSQKSWPESMRYYGGLEIHHRQPPDYMRGQSPSHNNCSLIGGPCWHDGSSQYVDEHWIPMWRMNVSNNERMLELLEGEYMKRFASEEDEVE